MLKRQRHTSPPPASQSQDVFIDSDPALLTTRKRRRTLPPVLDGQARGWGAGTQRDDDDEESDNDELVGVDEGSSPVPQPPAQWEYKSANNLLHDLHELHRHRFIIPSPSPLYDLSLDQSHRALGYRSAPKSLIPPSTVSNEPAGHMGHHDKYNRELGVSCVPVTPVSPLGDYHVDIDEVERVMGRYEESNKFV